MYSALLAERKARYSPTASPDTYIQAWHGQATSGDLSEIGTELGVVELPTGVIGILPILVQGLLDCATQGQSRYDKPGETLRKWIHSAGKWRPWLLHESAPGVPDWLWLELALPSILSLQTKTKEALPIWLTPYREALTPEHRRAFIGALVEGAPNPKIRGRPVTYPWIDAAHPNDKGEPQVTRVASRSDLRDPERALAFIMGQFNAPEWQAACLAHLPSILALFDRWRTLPYIRGDDAIDRPKAQMAYVTVLAPHVAQVYTGPDLVRWHLKTWPLPGPLPKFDWGGEGDERILGRWRQLLSQLSTAQVEAHLGPDELASLEGIPSLQAIRRQRLLQELPAPTTHRPRPRPRS